MVCIHIQGMVMITSEESLTWFLAYHETTVEDIPGRTLFSPRALNISDTHVPRCLVI